tara:strand:+ start:160 stop:393 length:234 start_codon:yes stop_codon:yes gene_type:complete
MVSLLMLKQLEDLSDEQVIRRWVDIPYWAVFIGRDTLSVETSCSFLRPDPFPKRIGKKGAGSLLKLLIDLFNPKIQQ